MQLPSIFLFAALVVLASGLESPVELASYAVDPAALSAYLEHAHAQDAVAPAAPELVQESPQSTSALAVEPTTKPMLAGGKAAKCEAQGCGPMSIVGELVPHEPGMGLTFGADGKLDTSKYDKLIGDLKRKVSKNNDDIAELEQKVKKQSSHDQEEAHRLKRKLRKLRATNKSLQAKLERVEKTPGPKGLKGLRGRRGKRGERGYNGAPGPRGKEGPPGPRGPRGRPGVNGGPGVNGRPGAPGAPGRRGPRGDRGPRGVAGLPGARGPVGLPGPRGPKGATGPRGKRGLVGRRGPEGAVGKMGLRGPQGFVGRRGPTGFRGKTGMPGKAGLDGRIGLPGLPGSPGPMGLRGLQGPRGRRGRIGPRGHRGLPGRRGPKGFTGPEGPRGARGDAGAPGFRGLPGLNGRNGKDGLPGRNGRPGKPGLPGRPGLAGPPGLPGHRGRPGLNGARGIEGARGKRGPTGPHGFPGVRGPEGPRGAPGRPGRSIVVHQARVRVSPHNKRLIEKLRKTLGHLHVEEGGGEGDVKHVKLQKSDSHVALYGSVINFVNNRRIPDTEVLVHKGHKKSGEVVKKTKTNGDGHFGLMLKPGKYMLTTKRHGFVGAPQRIHLKKGVRRSRVATGMSPRLHGEGVRFVLTWGAHPKDLDSHLKLPKSAKCTITYYHRMCSDYGLARLDLDSSRGSGPETITIQKQKQGTYEYTVHQYSKKGSLAKSKARVLVFTGGKVHVFRAAKAAKGKGSNGKISGKVWKVLKWEVDGEGQGSIAHFK